MAEMIGNLDDLITAIEHTARGEIQHKQSETGQQAEQILNEAREEGERIRQEILQRAGKQAEKKRQQQLAQAMDTAKQNYLTTREELLDQVWRQAEQKLRNLPDHSEAYVEALERLARLAAQTIAADHLILKVDPKGHRLLTNERLEAWSQSVSENLERPVTFERAFDPADSWGGMLVLEKGGRRQVDATLATRLEIAREEIRDRIFNHLVQEA